MAIVDRIRVGRAVSNMSALALVVLLSGHTGAIVLRSNTGAQHDFDDATFDAQSEKASNIRSNGNEPLPITKPVLDAIADYIKVIKLKGVCPLQVPALSEGPLMVVSCNRLRVGTYTLGKSLTRTACPTGRISRPGNAICLTQACVSACLVC